MPPDEGQPTRRPPGKIPPNYSEATLPKAADDATALRMSASMPALPVATKPEPEEPGAALLAEEEEEEEEDHRPLELRKYIKSLSKRQHDYFTKLEHKSFIYQHLELPTKKEPPPKPPPVPPSYVLDEIMRKNTGSVSSDAIRISRIHLRGSNSYAKGAFPSLFDTSMVHTFSVTQRFEVRAVAPLGNAPRRAPL